MKAKAYSTWHGTWKEGAGTISTEDRTLHGQAYSFASRFQDAPGASPEQLLAAAHAGCFNQALANNFGMLSLAADSIATAVTVMLDFDEQGRPTIDHVHISVRAAVPGASDEQFQHCAQRASSNCSISKILRCDISFDATLLM